MDAQGGGTIRRGNGKWEEKGKEVKRRRGIGERKWRNLRLGAWKERERWRWREKREREAKEGQGTVSIPDETINEMKGDRDNLRVIRN